MLLFAKRESDQAGLEVLPGSDCDGHSPQQAGFAVAARSDDEVMSRWPCRIKQTQLPEKEVEHVLPGDEGRQEVIFVLGLRVEVGNVHAGALHSGGEALPPAAQQYVAECCSWACGIPVVDADKTLDIQAHEQFAQRILGEIRPVDRG